MRRRVTATVLATLALVTPLTLATSADAASGSIVGTWKGKVHGDAGSPGAYPAVVKLKKHGAGYRGRIVYPGLCSGSWAYDGKKGHWLTFTETIPSATNQAGCVSPVDVKVRRKGSKLKVVWREPISGDVGTMVAKHR